MRRPQTDYQSFQVMAYAVLSVPTTVFTDTGSSIAAEQDYTIDIDDLELTYAQNSIPTARFDAIIGRVAAEPTIRSGVVIPETGRVMDIHSILARLGDITPVKIYAALIPRGTSFDAMPKFYPPNFFLVFDGDIVGYKSSRSKGSGKNGGGEASIKMYALHFLHRLTYASTATGDQHPRGLGQLTLPAGKRSKKVDGKVVTTYDNQDAALSYFESTTLLTDAWNGAGQDGQGLRSWLRDIARTRAVSGPDEAVATGETELNNIAANTLDRFEPLLTSAGLVYTYGVPCVLETSMITTEAAVPPPPPADPEETPETVDQAAEITKVKDLVSQAIASHVCDVTNNDLGSANLWDDMTGAIYPDLQLAVIPMADRALTVPYTAGYRHPYRVIYTEEYGTIAGGGESALRRCSGVRLLRGTGTGSSVGDGAERPSSFLEQIAGKYIAPGITGQVQCYMPPGWLLRIAPLQKTQRTLSTGNATVPSTDARPLEAAKQTIADRVSNRYGDRWARSLFIYRALRANQTATITGELRFDIAPGSTVEVRTINDRFIDDILGPDAHPSIVGEVASLTVRISRAGNSATTSFTLTNVRTAAENTQGLLSVDTHPVWKHAWNGAPLVGNTAFAASPSSREFDFWPAYLSKAFEDVDTHQAAIQLYLTELANPNSTLPIPFKDQILRALIQLGVSVDTAS